MSFTDIELICTKCQKKFWLSGAEHVYCQTAKLTPPDQCSACRGSLVSTRLPERVAKELANLLVGRGEALIADLRPLLASALTPIEERQRTWLEWMAGVDVQTKQLQQKYAACWHANTFIQQRTVLVQNLKKMILAIGELERVEIDSQLKLLQGRIALQRLEAELLRGEAQRLKLEEEIMQRQALRDERIRTLQLEEAQKQARLVESMNPPPPEAAETHEDRAQNVILEHLTNLQMRARARQEEISAFMEHVRLLYDSELEDIEIVARIRAVMETYQQDLTALPFEIRKFVERIERYSGGG